MKTTIENIPYMNLVEFADKHDLELMVVERKTNARSDHRYYAHFKNCEIKYGNMLVGTFGNGNTPKQAIDEYASKISMKRIVICAFSDDRLEIEVPRLK